MTARLVFVTGSRAGTSHALGPGTSTIGRGADQAVRFSPDEILVSSAHATIEERGGVFVLRDLDSRNGTWVNQARIAEHTLEPGDVIEFGRRGPTAQFVVAEGADLTTTLDQDRLPDAAELRKVAAARQAPAGDPAPQRHDTLGFSRGLSSTREFVVMTYQRSKRGRRTLLLLFAAVAVSLSGLLWWQIRSRSDLERKLLELGAALDSERGSRALLETNLSAIRAEYDSLLGDIEASRRLLESAEGGALADAGLAGRLSRGVALLVFSWGFAERGGSRMLRYQLDESGRPRMSMMPDGRPVPAFGFEGNGAPVSIQGSATGFLVDSTGWIVTNKHVAEPWLYRDDVAFLKDDPALEPRFITLNAYFPPGDKVFPLRVYAASKTREIDVAALRTANRAVDAPVVPLADPASVPAPGQALVFVGYPTGVHNLLFRVADSVRKVILEAVGQEPVALAAELARRRLIQPLTISGAVSDTTAVEIIHTAGTTGGGSGGPLIGRAGTVLGIHYAAVRSPIAGDPFQTQRAVRSSYAWTVLPASLRRPPAP